MTVAVARWTPEACFETIRRNVALIESESTWRSPSADVIEIAAHEATKTCRLARSEALLDERQIEEAFR